MEKISRKDKLSLDCSVVRSVFKGENVSNDPLSSGLVFFKDQFWFQGF
jgi:hypothetical protein